MLLVRRAEAEDIPAMSQVLTESITELCTADHQGDPAAIAAWTRNKSVDGVTAMFSTGHGKLFVAELDGVISAVGAVSGEGEITLNYVAPGARFRGVSKAMLAGLEAELRARGFAEGRLEATATARRFYEAAGWVSDGPQAAGRKVNGYPMRKVLS
jgi:GNAT superfamily N-acetyltransferase